MINIKTIFAALLLILSQSTFVNAAQFANQFVEFQLPANWQCSLEGAEWVCQNADGAKKREAIIILAAKLRGDQDSLEAYIDYLKKPKIWTSIDGRTVQSEARYARPSEINGHGWIDSLHLESEIPGFYTRYLATVKLDIGVLVTYSVQKDKYAEYRNDFENLVKTLKVFRKAGGLNANSGDTSLFQTTKIPSGVSAGNVFPNIQFGDDSENAPKKQDDTLFYLLVAAAGLIAIIILKKIRK